MYTKYIAMLGTTHKIHCYVTYNTQNTLLCYVVRTIHKIPNINNKFNTRKKKSLVILILFLQKKFKTGKGEKIG